MFTVENLSVHLGTNIILQNVDFTVDAPGRMVGLLGVNGNGKTTLLRAIPSQFYMVELVYGIL